MSTENKNKFGWKEGAVLDEDNTQPLGGVRVKGMKKIEQSPLADPKQRAEARKNVLTQLQTQSYEEQVKAKIQKSQPEETSLIVEETHSGVTGDFETSNAEKIFDTEAGRNKAMQNIGHRFGDHKPNSKK